MAEIVPSEMQEQINKHYLDMSPEMKELIHGWLYKIVGAAYEGISELPREHRDHVLMKMSKACSEQAKAVLGCQPGMEWEEYKRHMAGLEPPFGPRKVQQIGNVVHWTYVPPQDSEGKAICQCPLAMFGWIEPRPELCACSANSVASYIEEYTDVEVATVETLGSPCVNGENECRFLVHLKPSPFTTPKHET
jgi:hypothetical protein